MVDTDRAIRPNRSRRVIVDLVVPAHLDEEISGMVELFVLGLIEARV